jgi:beta-lactamase class A
VAALGLLLVGVAVTSPAAAADPAVASCGPSPLAPSYLDPWLERAGSIDVGISVVAVGGGCSFGSLPTQRFLTASVVKIQVMAGVLLALQESDEPMSYYLDGLLSNMIGASDNASTDQLVSWLGGLGHL